MFRAQLDDSLGALVSPAAKTPAATSTGTSSTSDADLAAAIKAQLDRGTSLDDVIARLASSLATSVAAQLGITTAAAAQRLTASFTQALQPSGAGPPGTNADRASSLVSAFRRIAGVATRVADGDTGQPIRTIAAQRSDADEAKATAAPTTDSLIRDALTALAAPASPAPDATASGATAPAATASAVSAAFAASDGRTVAISPAFAIATGGDTPLGRIIARAALPSAQAAPAAVATGETAARGTAANAAAASASNASPARSESGTLDAFVTAFASALANDAERDKRDLAALAAPAANADSAATSAASAQSAASLAMPVTRDAASIMPPAPAPPLPQPQPVDANAVVDQLLRGISVRTTDGSSQVHLRLVPETLGDVSVKLVVSGGSVDASITAHTPEAQSALAGAQSQLAKSFADAGLKLQSFNVGLAGSFADARDQSRSNESFARSATRRIGGVAAAQDESDDALLATPSIGPPIYSARSLPGAFNHLA